MTRALFSKKFYEKFTPKSEVIGNIFEFKGRNNSIIQTDFCIGPDWLSVANINSQLPDMPNKIKDDGDVLCFEEDSGHELGDRSFCFGGYMTCTLAKDPRKVIGCLAFGMSLYHVKAKKLRIFVELDGVYVANKYRRKYIASTMGETLGDYISERISIASRLLNYEEGSVSMRAEFDHIGGEACFRQMEAEIEMHAEYMFPDLELYADAGW